MIITISPFYRGKIRRHLWAFCGGSHSWVPESCFILSASACEEAVFEDAFELLHNHIPHHSLCHSGGYVSSTCVIACFLCLWNCVFSECQVYQWDTDCFLAVRIRAGRPCLPPLLSPFLLFLFPSSGFLFFFSPSYLFMGFYFVLFLRSSEPGVEPRVWSTLNKSLKESKALYHRMVPSAFKHHHFLTFWNGIPKMPTMPLNLCPHLP